VSAATGTVVRADAKLLFVEHAGEVRPFAPRGKLFDELPANVKNPCAVGDLVAVSLDGDPPGVEAVLPRRNWLSRVSSSHDPREQILFANVDRLFVIASLARPTFSSNRADRILAACAYAEIPAVLVLNKSDLDAEGFAASLRETYAGAGVPVVETCAARGEVGELPDLVRGAISVFYGGSGTGKSTILNVLEPALRLKTGKISKYWDAGKHTTSFSQMHRLPALDARVIDTPGIRVFRLADVNPAELPDCFPEFARFAPGCRYPGCAHDHEPGCAVFEAVEGGELAATRYASYLEIRSELVAQPVDDTPEPPPDAEP
jgi:ribosome biogenesis GTPase